MCVLLPLAPLLKMQYAYQVTHPHCSLAPARLLNSLTNFHRAFLQSLIITVLKHCWEGTGAVEMAVFTQRISVPHAWGFLVLSQIWSVRSDFKACTHHTTLCSELSFSVVGYWFSFYYFFFKCRCNINNVLHSGFFGSSTIRQENLWVKSLYESQSQ